MTNREVLEKRAAQLNLKVPAKTTDAQLEKLIATAEAEIATLSEALSKDNDALKKRVEEMDADLLRSKTELQDAIANWKATEADYQAQIAALKSGAEATGEPAEGDIECIVASGIVHDGKPYVPGDRISVTPAQFTELVGAGAVRDVALAPAD